MVAGQWLQSLSPTGERRGNDKFVPPGRPQLQQAKYYNQPVTTRSRPYCCWSVDNPLTELTAIGWVVSLFVCLSEETVCARPPRRDRAPAPTVSDKQFPWFRDTARHLDQQQQQNTEHGQNSTAALVALSVLLTCIQVCSSVKLTFRDLKWPTNPSLF